MMTQAELETLASNNPQELALIFAQKVAGFPEAWIGADHIWSSRDWEHLSKIPQKQLPDYLNDWTAVINAGKEAGIKWDRNVYNEDAGVEECFYKAWKWTNGWLDNRFPVKCEQEPGWPPCAALIIAMILVMEKRQ